MIILRDIGRDKGMAFERTHPWLKFEIDTKRAGPKLWMVLGEAQSKCEQLAGIPLHPEYAEKLHRLYMAKGVLATTAIEGNTLSEEEVLEHYEGKLKLSPSREYLATEIDNITVACNDLLASIREGKSSDLTPELVMELNARVLQNLRVDEDTVPGQIRRDRRVVGRYRCPPPEDCAYLLQRLCKWLNGDDLSDTPGHEIVCGLIRAIVAHVYFVWIHPFGDGNGRTARLIEVKFLLDAGVPSNAAHLLSNCYNRTRSEYYRQLDIASKSGGDLLPFIEYAVTGFVEELREQISIIRDQQRYVAWVNYVHDQFRDRKTGADQRRRKVVLALSEKISPVRKSKISRLSPEIAEEYAGKTSKMISRDLNVLVKMGLVERTRQGIRARKEDIEAFLPTRKRNDTNEDDLKPRRNKREKQLKLI